MSNPGWPDRPLPPLPAPSLLPPLPRPRAHLPVGLPVGTVVAFAGELRGEAGADCYATAVELYGWMVCDGRQLDRRRYRELFAALGYRYCQGGEPASGVAFRIPDLRGYFLRGVDPTETVDSDRRTTKAGEAVKAPHVGSVQECALQDHHHEYAKPSDVSVAAGSNLSASTLSEGATSGVSPEGQPATGQPTPDVLTSSTETRPVNVAVHYLIRFTNAI